MSTYIKTGYWEKLVKGYKGWLNLEDLIKSVVPASSLTTNQLAAIQNANAPTGTNPFATANDVIATKLFNQFTGYFSQTGTNAPTANSILKDSLGTPVWSYSTVGTYLLTKTGAFVANKTVPDKLESYIDNAGNKYTLERTSANVMTLKTYAAADTSVLANGVLSNQFINVEVYI